MRSKDTNGESQTRFTRDRDSGGGYEDGGGNSGGSILGGGIGGDGGGGDGGGGDGSGGWSVFPESLVKWKSITSTLNYLNWFRHGPKGRLFVAWG